MTPPSPGRRRAPEPIRVHNRRRKRLRAARKKNSRRTMLLVALIVFPVLVVAAGTVGATAVFGSSCDLKALRPVAVGENSFVYAANGARARRHPRRAEPNAGRAQADQPLGAGGDRRDRGSALLPARRRRSGGDRARRRRGRRAGKVVQGGSTITQELVRNLYLTRERTLKRKLTEACLAIKLSRQWSKDRILDAYMNQVFYGNHAYGIEAAAETYFSIRASKLNLEQAALLAGLPQAPSSYDPFRNPAAAIERRNEVLRAMLVNGDITSSRVRGGESAKRSAS